jgi:glycosyltransferase involved in cell wall biosynthesis
MKLSIIIPVFNEQNTILQILEKINMVDFIQKEIIIVDDCSSDKTINLLKNLSKQEYKIFYHNINLGKGAAIQTGKKFVTGDIVVIQDADLEYDPEDYKLLVEPIVNGKAKVVYGSRVLGKKRYSLKNFSSIYRIFFNHLLTIFSNIMNNQNLTDAHTCYKTFSKELFNSIDLKENGFSFCPEITTKIANKKIEIKEVPIEYYGRSYKEGKKINIIDGFKALFAIIKYRFLK